MRFETAQINYPSIPSLVNNFEFSATCITFAFVAWVILLVDDDDSFQLLIPRAVVKTNVQISFNFVADGDETMKYLGGKGPYSNRKKYPFPDLMLLDLKMPRVNGFEVLEWKLTQPALHSLPVVVWSSSSLDSDKAKALSLGALSYICKPVKLEEYVDVIHCLAGYCQAPLLDDQLQLVGKMI